MKCPIPDTEELFDSVRRGLSNRALVARLKPHYEKLLQAGARALFDDLCLRWRGALQSYNAMSSPQLKTLARQAGFRVSPRATKASLVRRLAQQAVPDWRLLTPARVPAKCTIPTLSKREREELENAPKNVQELFETLREMCDNPEHLENSCRQLDDLLDAAGYLTLADALNDFGFSKRSQKQFAKFCPSEAPIPF